MIGQLQDSVSHILVESTLESVLLWVLTLSFLRWRKHASPSVCAAAFLLPLLLPVVLTTIFHVLIPVRPTAMLHFDSVEALIGSELVLPVPLLIVCLLAGIAGIGASMALAWRQGLAWARVHRIWKQQQSDESPLRRRCKAALRAMTTRLGISTPRLILVDEGVGGSLTVGRRGYILVPRPLAAQLDDEELEAFLAHEISHILREDSLLGYVARVFRNLMLFNPLAHLALSGFERKQEEAADDLAARLGGNRVALASCLLKGYRFRDCRMKGAVSGLFGHSGALEWRVQRMLQPSAKESSRVAWLILAVLTGVSVTVFALVL